MESKSANYAICLLKPDLDSGVKGVVRFTQVEGEKTRVQAEVTGLKPGTHGFHVHEFGKKVPTRQILTARPSRFVVQET